MSEISHEELDDIHHALGRPRDREGIADAHRNYYCCALDSETSKGFEASPNWELNGTINGGRDGIWCVTEAGKNVLALALDAGLRAPYWHHAHPATRAATTDQTAPHPIHVDIVTDSGAASCADGGSCGGD